MTTTIERFHVDSVEEHPVYFEENGDLTVQLLRGGQRDAEYAEWGVVLTYLGVDDQHSQVSLRSQAGRARRCSPRPSSGSPSSATSCGA